MMKAQPEKYDLVVYGGNSAGIIAGHVAAKLDLNVIILEPTKHIGGLSTGGLGASDIADKATPGGLARLFYRRLGEHYGTFESYQFEPSVAMSLMESFLKEADLEVHKKHRLEQVIKSGTQIESIVVFDGESGTRKWIAGDMFIDATYEGDLMAQAGVSYYVGREPNAMYGETNNGVQYTKHKKKMPEGIDPYVIPGDPTSGLIWGVQSFNLPEEGAGDHRSQAYNFRMCLTKDPENRIPFTRPEGYDPAHYEVLARIIEKYQYDDLKKYFLISPMPNNKTDINNSGGFSTDLVGFNYDYAEADWDAREEIIETHVQFTQGLFYFMANDPRVPEGVRAQMQQYGYPKDEYVDNNHFSPQLYVREVRRMIGAYVVTDRNALEGIEVSDPIAYGDYGLDSHSVVRIVRDGEIFLEGNINVEDFPTYGIPYRSITPKATECTNLLVPTAMSATHAMYGSIRMEPVFMELAQAAAIAAHLAIKDDTQVQAVDYAAMMQIKAADPFMNGSALDITVDNADADHVTFQGEWQTYERLALPRPFASTYHYSEDKHASVEIRVTAQKTGRYALNFFHPTTILFREHADSVQISWNDGEATVDFNEYWRKWATVGHTQLKAGEELVIKMSAPENTRGPLVFDGLIINEVTQ